MIECPHFLVDLLARQLNANQIFCVIQMRLPKWVRIGCRR
jgi:hypothetical protein